jgi:hypothetical protein
VLWQRLSVVFTELIVLRYAVQTFMETWPVDKNNAELSSSQDKRLIAMLLLAFDPNLLLVDHVHFQVSQRYITRLSLFCSPRGTVKTKNN